MSSLGFSYAQAARGLAPSSNVSSNPTSSASSEKGTTAALDQHNNNSNKRPGAPVRNTKETTPTERILQPSPRVEEETIKADLSFDSATAHNHEQKDVHTRRTTVDDGSNTRQSSARVSVASNADKEDHTEDLAKSVDAVDAQEKSKDADDDWEKVSVPSSAAEKTELKAAPPPQYNVWQVRQQIQQAKMKDQIVPKPATPATSQPAKPKPATNHAEEGRRKPAARDAPATDPPTSTKSTARASRETGSVSPRGNPQPSDKPTPQQSPPVDVVSWPTPESAIVDSSRRASAADKVDRSDNLEPKTRKKPEWTQMPFVPSVKFETQLPASGRRGGRPAQRGRGGNNSVTERNPDKMEPGSMPPPPLPKNISDQDRGRKGSAPKPTRASSVPIEGQRTVDEDNKQPLIGLKTTPDAGSSKTDVTAQNAPKTGIPSQEGSRASSRNPPGNPKTQRPVSGNNGTQTAELTGSPPRISERAKQANTEPQNGNSETTERPQKDTNIAGTGQKSKDWRAERPQRGERPERGRGAYRGGRGNHSQYSNPSHTSPLPQNGFESAKQGGPVENRSRQPSQPFTSPYSSMRGPSRNNSTPVNVMQPGFYQPGPVFSHNLPPIQTDVRYGGYGQTATGGPGPIMSAMPYGDPLGGYGLITMVVTQLEYYFSIDNLCKDMFLRKNMDSQGFVPLRIIADFRRIRALLGDSNTSYDQLRQVALTISNIDLVSGEDGEYLRNRETWKDFVLPMEERLPTAQHDGPKIRATYPRHSTGMAHEFHMSNGLRSAPPNINGFHDFHQSSPGAFQPNLAAEPQSTEQWAQRVESARQDEERRMSTTSPLSKVQSPNGEPRAIMSTLTNGHRDSMSSNATAAKENMFPDEEVARLKVVVKDPDFQGEDDVMVDEPLPIPVSGLRGGAGSPEQFERIRGLQFGQSANVAAKPYEQTMYFTQGEAPPHYLRPGYIHEEYFILREKALVQRTENHFDGACIPLYPLWAEFLTVPNQFNIGMYEDFRNWALEDLEKGNDNGKKHLVKFYDTMLNSKSAVTERLAADIVNIAKAEDANNRPVWLKLRAAWRNGATNMKTRKRLTDLLTREEQQELD